MVTTTNAKMASSTGKKRPLLNSPSILLTKEENEEIFRLITLFNPRNQSLATAVVQLYLTSSPNHNIWHKQDEGILCLVKDNPKKTYFFRIYCTQRRLIVWQQEIYLNIEYKSPLPYFHTFEADNCMAAFNFASEHEADLLKRTLQQKLSSKRGVTNAPAPLISATNSQMQSNHQRSISSGGQQNRQLSTMSCNNSISNPALNQNNLSIDMKKKKHKRRYTKDQISQPTDFVHVSSVKWDANKNGLNYHKNTNDPNQDDIYKEFFDKAGISERDLNNPDYRSFIYGFISDHGGADRIKQELQMNTGQVANQGTNQSVVTQPSREEKKQQPPPIPARTNLNQQSGRSAKGPARMPPPISRPTVQAVNNVRNHISHPQAISPQRNDVTSTVEQPPPPPLPSQPPPKIQQPVAPVPPPPPMMENFDNKPNISMSKAHAEPDQRSALLDSIRQGISLKHVENKETTRTSPSGPSGDARNDLLSEIRQGIELKPVQKVEAPAPQIHAAGLAGALARALAERKIAIHSDSSSSETSNTDNSDSEWDD